MPRNGRVIFIIETIVGLLFLGISLFLFVPAWMDLPKDIFRVFRSEIHLAQFIFERNPDEPSARMPPLQVSDHQKMIFIAHATGHVHGRRALNSLEGLYASVTNGCKYIEADFEWTSDHQLVSSHDWDSYFGDSLQAPPDLNAFKSRVRSDGFTQMTFADVDAWLALHPAMQLITDVKSRNLEALKLFLRAKSFRQIIPQTYSFLEFSQARRMGFEKVILTTYKTYYSNSSLVRFVRYDRPSALTVPVFRLTPELINAMAALDVPVFTHPISQQADFDKLPKGVKGVYSLHMCRE